jgi:hypothetical protein
VRWVLKWLTVHVQGPQAQGLQLQAAVTASVCLKPCTDCKGACRGAAWPKGSGVTGLGGAVWVAMCMPAVAVLAGLAQLLSSSCPAACWRLEMLRSRMQGSPGMSAAGVPVLQTACCNRGWCRAAVVPAKLLLLLSSGVLRHVSLGACMSAGPAQGAGQLVAVCKASARCAKRPLLCVLDQGWPTESLWSGLNCADSSSAICAGTWH